MYAQGSIPASEIVQDPMSINETTAFDHPASYSNLLAGNKVSLPALPRSVNELGEQIDKLGGIIGQLEDRLMSVRNSSPTAEQTMGQPEPAPTSPLVNQVQQQIRMVGNLQRRMNDLLAELEV